MLLINKNFKTRIFGSYGAAAGIAAVLLVALCFFWLKSPDYKQIHYEVSELAKAIRGQYQKRPDYWGLNTQKIINEGFISEKFLRNEKIISSLGREFIIGSNAQGDTVMPSGRQFVITIADISRNACEGLLKQANISTADPSLDAILIQNDDENSEFGWSEENNFSKLTKNAKSICKNRNKISWRFN